MMTFVLLAAGLVLLVLGAEWLVKGASKLAAGLGIPPLVIGLTIVAYGTSAPELVVSTVSSLAGQADIALGNVVGSNIFNVLFILGISALIAPLIVAQQLIRLDVPIMIGVSALTLMFGLDGQIGRIDGLILVIGGIAYTIFQIIQGSQESNPEVQQEYASEYGDKPDTSLPQTLFNVGYIVLGLVLLVIGSRWLVESSTTIARSLGVSDLIIGLTIVAAGTSLPELATSVVASLRGERDIAIGNVVGSNIFNILIVLGVSGFISPEGLTVSTAALRFDIPVMIAVAVACLPIFFTGYLICRREGLLFLGYYAAYVGYLTLAATKHDSLPAFSGVLLFVVIPLTAIILIISALEEKRSRKANRQQKLKG
jgi:cation:H+ antiporter